MSNTDSFEEPGGYVPRSSSAEDVLAYLFEGVERDQSDLNSRAAFRAEGIARALAYARQNPSIYALPGDPHAEETAVRCAVLDAATRLSLSEAMIRSLADTAERAMECLPLLWQRAQDGFAAMTQVETAVAQLARFESYADSMPDFDGVLSELVLHATPASFRVKATRLARTLTPGADAQARVAALAARRVVVQDVADGMSWVMALTATTHAHAIKRRLTATAKHLKKDPHDHRTRDQIRADLFSDWMRGVGTPTAVKTKVFVTVPVDRLSDAARSTVRRSVKRSKGTPVVPGAAAVPGETAVPGTAAVPGETAVPGTAAVPGETARPISPADIVVDSTGIDLNAEPLVIGDGPIDSDLARQSLLEAGAFTRVITDPVTGVILDMDRRSRKITRAQREWLLLQHDLCVRDGCVRRARDAEIDHWSGYHGPERGPTNIDNLHPLCESDHRPKDTTKIVYERRDDGSVGLAFPTGSYTSRLIGDRTIPDEPPF